jgi:hypothetical protein
VESKNKTMKKRYFLLIATIAIFTSCEKTPDANFTTSGSCVAGSTIELYNTTQNGDHYQWTMPDGSISTDANPIYTTSLCDNGTENFTLEAFSKNGKKTSQAYNTVYVSPRGGNITFWTNDPTTITVSLGGIDEDITQYYTGSYPSGPGCCDAYGCANFDGAQYCQDYSFYATDGTYSWSGDINIGSDCFIEYLQLSKGKKLSNPNPHQKSIPYTEQMSSKIATHDNLKAIKLK